MAKRQHIDLFTDAKRAAAEAEIKAKQREIKYDLRDFTIDYIVREYREGLFFSPDYQREFVWDGKRQCRFIESVLLGLPLPMMFVADLDDGRLEIVDGVQRIETLEKFRNDDLTLANLDRLPTLNGSKFSDLPESQQRKFGTKALRVVVLEDATTPDTRQEIFDRINTSPLRARGAEIRRGAQAGPFADFIQECATNPLFLRLCPISKMLIARRENEELVMRFFAYSDHYKEFKHDVDKFLTAYAKENRDNFDANLMKMEFDRMLDFVSRYFPYGFAKNVGHKTTPRVRFEAISVGVNLALRKRPQLVPALVTEWLNSDEFNRQVTTHASNSGPRLRGRVEYVRNQLLGVGS
jgi:hypothetical protein